MEVGEADHTPATGFPSPSTSPVPPAPASPDSPSPASSGSTPPAPTDSGSSNTRTSPELPAGSAEDPPATTTTGTQPEAGSSTWYRSDQERHKSVHRRANPWYRRLGRGLVALTFLTALGAGLYFGARLVQDYLDRDRLPSAGTEVPEIRSTSFQVRSSSPAPEVDGTLTIDASSRAFQFVGRNGGPNTGVQVVSPNGSTTYISGAQGEWAILTGGGTDPGRIDRDDLLRVVRYLSNDKNADAILTNRLRRGYIDLVEQSTEGVGDDQLIRYELEIDTLEFSLDYPLQWRDFQRGAIPGVQEVRSLPMIIWLDVDKVLVRVRDEQTNWSWERLTYSNQPFTPIDPASTLIEETTDTAPETTDP